MNRPSEVPPPVENLGFAPVSASMARVTPADSAPGGV